MRILVCESTWIFIVVGGWPLFLGIEVFFLWESFWAYFAGSFLYRNPLRYLKTWRARHFLIYATMIGKQSFTNVVSLPYAFSLNPVSFRIPSALLYRQLHDPVSLRVRLAGASPFKSLLAIIFEWGLTGSVAFVHFQPSAYLIVSNFYFILISCPLLHILITFYTDGLWS